MVHIHENTHGGADHVVVRDDADIDNRSGIGVTVVIGLVILVLLFLLLVGNPFSRGGGRNTPSDQGGTGGESNVNVEQAAPETTPTSPSTNTPSQQ